MQTETENFLKPIIKILLRGSDYFITSVTEYIGMAKKKGGWRNSSSRNVSFSHTVGKGFIIT